MGYLVDKDIQQRGDSNCNSHCNSGGVLFWPALLGVERGGGDLDGNLLSIVG